jgi:hypothetical protein
MEPDVQMELSEVKIEGTSQLTFAAPSVKDEVPAESDSRPLQDDTPVIVRETVRM